MKPKTYTLEDLLRAINVLEEDIDVSVDGYGTIAVVAPIELTPTAKEKFATTLKLPVRGTSVYSNKDGDDGGKECKLAWDLLSSLAGYCPSQQFDKWFEGDDAEQI